MKVIALSYFWNFNGRAETVRSALDVLAVCSVQPQVQLLFCEAIRIPEDDNAVGFNIILGAADGDIVADPEVQRAALNVLIHCVCAPEHRVGGSVARINSERCARRRNVVSSNFLATAKKKRRNEKNEARQQGDFFSCLFICFFLLFIRRFYLVL